jgi:iron-sulfur cluster assembly protein
MRLEPQARERDQVVEAYGARVFVDPKSYVYLDNITLDFQVTRMRQGFVFQNPQAARTCGCGTSFTV